MDCAAASLVTAIKAGCVVAARNLLNGLQSVGDRGAKLPRRLVNAYVVAAPRPWVCCRQATVKGRV
jgi:hypothetical protein